MTIGKDNVNVPELISSLYDSGEFSHKSNKLEMLSNDTHIRRA